MANIQISRVSPADSNTIDAFYALWEKVFGAEELEDKSITIAAMNGEYPVLYRVYVAKDGEKVVGVIAGGLDDLEDNYQVLMIGYAATDEAYRLQGIQRQLFNELVRDAAADASAKGKTLAVITSEATDESVPMWGKLGFDFIPVTYIQPALDFDLSTGLPAEDADDVQENLMLAFNVEPNKHLVSKAVEAIYRWSNLWPREKFESDEAYAAHVAYVDHFQRQFDAKLQVTDIEFGHPTGLPNGH
jgi:GNAT superfamily N-acetyltransferase